MTWTVKSEFIFDIFHSYCVDDTWEIWEKYEKKILFNWSLFLITQCNCTSIGLLKKRKKRTNGSVVAACEPMAMQPAIACQNGRGVWLYKK